jgi:hypothetical protein
MDPNPKNPAIAAAPADAGADTQRRFRHQSAYIARVALGLLNPRESELAEVYCEHHEDVLLRKCSGKFIGVQLKTRELKYGAFKITDEPIVNSVRRFIELELAFPDQFEAYRIGSNAGFADGRKLQPITKFFQLLRPHSDDLVIRVLSKLDVEEMSGLDDIESRLRDEVSRLPVFAQRTHEEVTSAVDRYLLTVFRASSLESNGHFPAYASLCAINPETARQEHRIAGKCLHATRVEEALYQGLAPRAESTGIPHEIPTGAQRFFGREPQLKNLITRLRERRNTTVQAGPGFDGASC